MDGDSVLPCSRSCWSYHGSSSSVTNSSILAELSMGRSAGRNRRNKPLCVDSEQWSSERRRRRSLSFKAELRARSSSQSVSQSGVCALCRVSSRPPSSSGVLLSLPPLIPAPPSTGPSRCLEPPQMHRGSDRRGSDVATAALPRLLLLLLPTLPPLSAAACRGAFTCRTADARLRVLFPPPPALGPSAPSTSSTCQDDMTSSKLETSAA